MDFKATFNNISVMSWRSVLLVEETVVLGENLRPVTVLLVEETVVLGENHRPVTPVGSH